MDEKQTACRSTIPSPNYTPKAFTTHERNSDNNVWVKEARYSERISEETYYLYCSRRHQCYTSYSVRLIRLGSHLYHNRPRRGEIMLRGGYRVNEKHTVKPRCMPR